MRIKDREPTYSASCGQDGKGVLQYKIVCTDDPFRTEGKEEVYSLAVISTRGDGDSESYFAYDVARSYTRAAYLAKLLCRMTVFPENVPEVLTDTL
ncbi:MAG: hypothetical protein IJR90_07940 [Clostridia bacterium]|nr:hypothetical protein [Clostridia bacterium]